MVGGHVDVDRNDPMSMERPSRCPTHRRRTVLLTELAAAAEAELIVPPTAQGPTPDIVDALPPGEASGNVLTMIDSIDRHEDVQAVAVVTPVALHQCDRYQLVHPDPHAAFATIVRVVSSGHRLAFDDHRRYELPSVRIDSPDRDDRTRCSHRTRLHRDGEQRDHGPLRFG